GAAAKPSDRAHATSLERGARDGGVSRCQRAARAGRAAGMSLAVHVAGDQPQTKQGHAMGLGTLLLILLVLLLIGVLPTWPHSSSWGYGPSGGLGVILVIVLILVLMGRI